MNEEHCLERKIHLSNSLFSSLRESYEFIIDAPIRITDLFVKKRFVNIQLKDFIENQDNEIFIKIQSNWIFEEKNLHQGFNSLTFWIRNPLNERYLIKYHSNPFTVANEYLAYSIGKLINLPVNQVHISIYENNLVTLHQDVRLTSDENVISFNHLSKNLQNKLLKSSLFGSMDLFDKFFMNIDRNPTNILIRYKKQNEINEENIQIDFIDHSSSFGMGEFSLISTIANKAYSKHLQIKTFHPNKQAKVFEKYLLNLSQSDRFAIQKTLNSFSQITNQQIQILFNQIQFLLTKNQYQRIYQLCLLQRDLIRFYTFKWNLIQLNI